MRKILLGTTAVVGAALIAPAAFAQAPVTAGTPGQSPQLSPGAPVSTPVVAAPTPALAGTGGLRVRLGGFFDFQAGMVQDDWDRAASRNGTSTPAATNRNGRARTDMRNDLELNVFIDGRASNGMTYGAVFEFQMDNNNVGSGHMVDMDEAYLYLSFPGMGTLRFGQEDNAASLIQVRPPSSQALGGDGEWWRFINNSGLPAASNMYLTSGINDGNDATKIIYLSPQFAGFDFALSFGANQGEGRRTDAQRDRTTNENEWSAAVRYRGTFGPVGFAAGFGAMGANAPRLNSDGVSLNQTAANGITTGLRGQQIVAYTTGASVSAYGFSFGGEFTWGQYNGTVGRNALAAGLDDSYHYMLGASYTLGPVVFGAIFGQAFQDNGTRVTRDAAGAVTNIQSVSDREHTIWGVGAAYNLAPGLILYTYYNHIRDQNVAGGTGPSDGRYFGGGANGLGSSGTTLASFNGGNTRTINVGAVGVRLAF